MIAFAANGSASNSRLFERTSELCNKISKVYLVVRNMNLNKLLFKENQAMRERYGFWAVKMLVVLTVLLGFSMAVEAQILPPPKFYPTISITNYTSYPDGIIRVPAPGPGGDRYFLVPVFIYNEVDTTFNPNLAGQHLEPIRSFDFQMTYLTQAMVLDENPAHGPAVITVGPGMDAASQPALAKNFYIHYQDVADPGQENPNPFQRRIRISAASEVPLPLSNRDTNGVLVYVRFKVVISNINAGVLQLDSARFNDHMGDYQITGIPFVERGNLGGSPTNRGGGIVQITDQPAFEFRPLSIITTDDNKNFLITRDFVFDPTISVGNPQ